MTIRTTVFSILALLGLSCLAPVTPTHAQAAVRGLLAASRACDLTAGDDVICSDEAVFLGGELEFRRNGRIDAVSVDRDGVFEAELSEGTYRVSLRKLRLAGKRLNPENFRLSKRRIKAKDGALFFLAVRHRSRSSGDTPEIGY